MNREKQCHHDKDHLFMKLRFPLPPMSERPLMLLPNSGDASGMGMCAQGCLFLCLFFFPLDAQLSGMVCRRGLLSPSRRGLQRLSIPHI